MSIIAILKTMKVSAMMTTKTRLACLFTALALVACDGGAPETDGGMSPDGGMTPDGGPAPDGGPLPDGGLPPDGGPPPTDGGRPPIPEVEPIVLALSETGHDRLFGLSHDAEGRILGTGQIQGTGSDFETFVIRLTPAGVLDTTFATGGILRVNVTPGGGSRETGRAIAVQSTGRIIVAGTTEHDPSAAGLLGTDTDWFVLGVTPDGALDSTFGTEGIQRIDVGDGLVAANAAGVDTLFGPDVLWGLGIDSMNRIVLHGYARNPGELREDNDFVLLRRLANGANDTSFATDGRLMIDLDSDEATGRSVTVLPDDSLVGAGYTRGLLEATTNPHPVVYKVTAAGQLDPEFARRGDGYHNPFDRPGIWHGFAGLDNRWAEAYYGAPQSDGSFVSIGYGATPNAEGRETDWISLRWNADGTRDETYGVGGAGHTYVDVAGVRDNGRFITTLPDDRTISVGRAGRPDSAVAGGTDFDGMVLILSPTGTPDASFGPAGYRTFDFGTDDHFWAAAVHESSTASWAVVGGIASGAPGGTDDAVIVIIPL